MSSPNSKFEKFNNSIQLIKNKKIDSIYFLMGDDQFLQSFFINQLETELSKVACYAIARALFQGADDAHGDLACHLLTHGVHSLNPLIAMPLHRRAQRRACTSAGRGHRWVVAHVKFSSPHIRPRH